MRVLYFTHNPSELRAVFSYQRFSSLSVPIAAILSRFFSVQIRDAIHYRSKIAAEKKQKEKEEAEKKKDAEKKEEGKADEKTAEPPTEGASSSVESKDDKTKDVLVPERGFLKM